MRKFKSAIVHIGLHKTGTTSVQNFLFNNRKLLEEKADLFYPDFDVNHSIQLSTIVREHYDAQHLTNLRLKLTTPELFEAQQLKWRQQIEQQFQSTTASHLILSGEGLSKLNSTEVSIFRTWLDQFVEKTTILVVFREPFAWSKSIIQQSLKAGRTLKELYSNPFGLHEAMARVQLWINAYGRGAIKAADFDALRKTPEGLVLSFVTFAGIDKNINFEVLENEHLNKSFCAAAIMLYDALNTLEPLVIDGKINSKRSIYDVSFFKNLKGESFQLPLYVQEKISEQSVEAVQWLSEHFGIQYTAKIPALLPKQSEWLTQDSAAWIAKCICGFDNLEKQVQTEIKDKGKALINLKAMQDSLKSYQKQVESWNRQSWWKRAFHHLRLK